MNQDIGLDDNMSSSESASKESEPKQLKRESNSTIVQIDFSSEYPKAQEIVKVAPALPIKPQITPIPPAAANPAPSNPPQRPIRSTRIAQQLAAQAAKALQQPPVPVPVSSKRPSRAAASKKRQEE